jgi:hypothetical protein
MDEDEGQKEVELSIASGAGLTVQKLTVRAGERKTAAIALRGAGGPPPP